MAGGGGRRERAAGKGGNYRWRRGAVGSGYGRWRREAKEDGRRGAEIGGRVNHDEGGWMDGIRGKKEEDGGGRNG